MTVFSSSESVKNVFPATPWTEAADWELVRDGLETRNMPGSDELEVEVGLQACDEPSSVGSAVALATKRTTDGLTYPVGFVDKTAATGTKRLVRGVYLVKNKTGGGSTARFCWASGVIETQKK